jgi:hypothetical protein
VNEGGNPESLVPSQLGNANAVKHGVHSPRLIQTRAAEIESELSQSFEFSATQRLALHEVARCIAILEAIDRDLDERGVVDRGGKPRYLLNHRSRISRQLDQWLAKISEAIERQRSAEQEPSPVKRDDYVRELQRIGLGKDPSASTRDRLAALRELLKHDTQAGSPSPNQTVTLIVERHQDGTETIEEEPAEDQSKTVDDEATQ